MTEIQSNSILKPGGWPSIIGIFLCGILGSASLAKLIPLGADFAANFDTSLADFGFLISLVGIPAALLALPSGLVVDRYGSKIVLLTCCVVGILVNIGYLFSPTLLGFQALRLVEGAVMVFTYTAAPAYLMNTTDGPMRSKAMALWSAYPPIGMTAGLVTGGLFAGTELWRNTFAIHIVGYIVVGLLLVLQENVLITQEIKTLKQRLKDVGIAYASPTLLLLGGIFLVLICLGLGANTTFPSYFAKTHDLTLANASGIVASVTLVMVLGSFVVGYLMSKGIKPGTLFIAIAVAGMIFGTLSFYSDLSLTARTVAVAGWFVASGAATAAVMTLMPIVTTPEQRAPSAAILNQGGAIATFITPPIWLSLMASDSWIPFAAMFCGGLTLTAIGVLILLRRAKAA